MNIRFSARIVERLCAAFRSHQRYADGSLRDSAVFLIVAQEWPALKRHLEFKLAGN